jgi:type III pantothenate kinase
VNKYDSPETLGKDRLAAAVAGNHLFPNQNVLVIDAGTCIKYDFINAQAEYLGGAISPGLQMRFNALHIFTEKLPLIELTVFKTLIGKNTTDSLLSGVINGTLSEIDGIIDQYREIYPEIQIVLSGGDAEYLVGKLKKGIFAVSNIVLQGLKIILDYNDKQKAL